VLVGRHLLSIAGGWGAYRIYAPVLGSHAVFRLPLTNPIWAARYGGGGCWRGGGQAGGGVAQAVPLTSVRRGV